MKDILGEIGLTKTEINVYLAVLDLGDSTRSNIVKKSGISGSKVYDILHKLKEKGLMSIYDKNRVRHFKPTNPKQLLNYIDEKKQAIQTMEKDVKAFMSSLMLRYNTSSKQQEVELLSGLKGLEIIFREQIDMLKKGNICYVIGGTKGNKEEHIVAFFQKIHSLREKKKIKTKMLYNTRQKKETQQFYSTKQYPHTETRYIQHNSPVAINIFKDRTVIIIFGEEITAIHVKSEEVAESFKEYFELLWKQAK